MNEQTKKIEALAADADRTQKLNIDIQAKLEKVVELERANTELHKIRDDLSKQLHSVVIELKNSRDETKAAQDDAQILKDKIANKLAIPTTNDDKAYQEKYLALQEEHRNTKATLKEWAELAQVCLGSHAKKKH